MNEDLVRLGRIVKDRRDELGLSQMEVWKGRGGPSTTKLGNLEDGDPPFPSATTKKKLETALEWSPGSVDRILSGGEPVIVEPEVSAPSESPGKHGSMASDMIHGLVVPLLEQLPVEKRLPLAQQIYRLVLDAAWEEEHGESRVAHLPRRSEDDDAPLSAAADTPDVSDLRAAAKEEGIEGAGEDSI